jgi:hypothetical protein
MRLPILLLALSTAAPAADALAVTGPTVSLVDDGINEPTGTLHNGGDIIFFTCRISNYTRSAESKVHLAYSVETFDPKGVLLVETYKNSIVEDVAPEDKEWLPRIATDIALPPSLLPGKYKIVVKVEDLFAKANASLDVPFSVRGHTIQASDKLSVQNMRFFRNEEDTKPLDKPVYKAGDALWFRFDVNGYKYAASNAIDLNYIFSVLGPDGSALWTAREPVLEQGESFYPKPFVSGAFSIKVQDNVKPGDYAIGVKVTDANGKQVAEAKQPFTVQ